MSVVFPAPRKPVMTCTHKHQLWVEPVPAQGSLPGTAAGFDASCAARRDSLRSQSRGFCRLSAPC